ncbi:hypothetical protein ABZW49_29225 [Nonomuraea wenchangensis]
MARTKVTSKANNRKKTEKQQEKKQETPPQDTGSGQSTDGAGPGREPAEPGAPSTSPENMEIIPLVRTMDDQARPVAEGPFVRDGAFLHSLPVDVQRAILQFLSFDEFMSLFALNRATPQWLGAMVKTTTGANRQGVVDFGALAYFWIRTSKRIVPGASPFEVLSAAIEIAPSRLNPTVWKVLGSVLQSEYDQMPDILADLALARGEYGDPDLVREIYYSLPDDASRREVITRYAEFGGNLNPLRLIEYSGQQDVLLPDEASDLTPTDEAEIKRLVKKNLDAKQKGFRAQVGSQPGATKDYRAAELKKTSKEQRARDRLAWVLTFLKDARECVAVAESEGILAAWANHPDPEMQQHLATLLQAARLATGKAAGDVAAVFDLLWQPLSGSKLDKRKSLPTDRDYNVAKRRLVKTIQYLGELQEQWEAVRATAYTARYHGRKEPKVHAEAKGASTLTDARARLLKDMESIQTTLAEEGEEVTEVAQGILVQLEAVSIALGISKLCCFKCWHLMDAAGAEDVELNITGTHNTVYKWDMPTSLAVSPKVLKAFLDIDDTDELAAYIDDERKRAAVVKAINTFSKDTGSIARGYYSSEEEPEDMYATYPDMAPKPLSPDPVKPKRSAAGTQKKKTTTSTPAADLDYIFGDLDSSQDSSGDEFKETSRKRRHESDEEGGPPSKVHITFPRRNPRRKSTSKRGNK